MKIVQEYVPLFVVLFLLVFISAVLHWDLRVLRGPLREDNTTNMQTLPSDVKEKLRTASSSAKMRIPVLIYHYVENVKDPKDTIRKSLNIRPDIFEAQIKTLVDQGYVFMTVSDLGEVLDGKRVLPTKSIVLTFDDGYRDFYTDAFPILKKYHVKATAFIVTSFIGKPNNMDENQIAEILKSGIVEIGAHTNNHVYLKDLYTSEAVREIWESKKILEAKFHRPVVSFAYPYGAFDTHTIDLVKQSGFKIAVSTIPGIEVGEQNRFFVYRIRSGERTGEQLLQYLNQTIFTF